MLKQQRSDMRVVTYRYGYFLALAFAIPPLRWFVVRRFRLYLEDLASDQHNTAIDIVAHSFGTYIVSSALRQLSAKCGLRVDTLLLAGSVLRPGRSMADLLSHRVTSVINDCGTLDVWPLVAQYLALGMGAAGRFGLAGPTGPDSRVVNRYFHFGHSGFFEATDDFPADENEFMRQKWVPILLGRSAEQSDQIPERASWWTPILVLLEPIKLSILLAPIVFVSVVLHDWIEDIEQAQLILVNANGLVNTQPTSAFILALEADRLNSSELTHAALARAAGEIEKKVALRRSADKDWSPPDLWSAGWRNVSEVTIHHPSLDLAVSAERSGNGHHVRLIDLASGWEHSLEPATEESRFISTLRFSSSGNYIFVGRHAFFEIYNLRGDLLAAQSNWITKEQVVYVELLDNDGLLLVCANDGKVILFRFNETGEMTQLTREFQLKMPAALITLDVEKTAKRLFALHREGYATWWEFNARPENPDARVNIESIGAKERNLGYLVPLHSFGLPANRDAELGRPAFSFSRLDQEFIVSADMEERNGRVRFVTAFRLGNPSVWEAVNDTVTHKFDLPHPVSQVFFVGFGVDGRLLTIDKDRTARVFSEDGRLSDVVDLERMSPKEIGAR